MQNSTSCTKDCGHGWLFLVMLIVGLTGVPGCDHDNSQFVLPNGPQTPTPVPTASATPIPTSTSPPGPTSTKTATPSRVPTPSPTLTPTPAPTLAPTACLPSSSIGILVQGTDVTAYSPDGWWGTVGNGLHVVPVETSAGIGTGGAPTLVTTPHGTNSCSCNSLTGETVCVANNTDVYLITGTTLNKTLTSGASAVFNFSGGTCMNCGVVVDSTTNAAEITIGLKKTPSCSGAPFSDACAGYQFLDLASESFSAPIVSLTGVSEDTAVDPIRNLILSPNEAGSYELAQTKPPFAVFENKPTLPVDLPPDQALLDSAAEDCTTGIALAPVEGRGYLFITDLTQANFTTGTPNTWTAPGQFQDFPDFHTVIGGAGPGVAVAPGTHLGVLAGEFGGNGVGVIQLPSTSGSGTPAVVDWATFMLPNTPNGLPWSAGFDPHSITAYVSPNSKKALGVIGNGAFTFLAIVDLEGVLKAPRTAGTHVVDPSVDVLKAGLVTFVAQ